MVKMASNDRSDSRSDTDQLGSKTMEHLGLQHRQHCLDHSWYHVARMEPHSSQRGPDGNLRRGPIEMVMSGSSGKSMLLGNGKHLLGSSDHTVNIADHIDHRFNLKNFLESTVWLNDNIGSKNWCYDGMIYYFKDQEDLISFKLRYLFDA